MRAGRRTWKVTEGNVFSLSVLSVFASVKAWGKRGGGGAGWCDIVLH